MPGQDEPIVESAVAVPVVPSAAPEAPAAQPDPVVVASPAPDSPPEAGAVDAKPDFEPTLLDKFDAEKAAENPAVEAKPEEKPAEVKADDKPAEPAEPKAEEKPAEEVKGDAPSEKPAIEAVDYFAPETGIKLPETLKLDDATRTEVAAAFDLLRTDPKAGGQALVDFHNKQMTAAVEAIQSKVTDGQWSAFRDVNKRSIADVMADPVLGGAGHQTAMAKVAYARDHLASTAKPGSPQYEADIAELTRDLKETGAGNRKSILRLLHNASKYIPEAAIPQPGGKPPADIGRTGRKGKLNYTHPTSNPAS